MTILALPFSPAAVVHPLNVDPPPAPNSPNPTRGKITLRVLQEELPHRHEPLPLRERVLAPLPPHPHMSGESGLSPGPSSVKQQYWSWPLSHLVLDRHHIILIPSLPPSFSPSLPSSLPTSAFPTTSPSKSSFSALGQGLGPGTLAGGGLSRHSGTPERHTFTDYLKVTPPLNPSTPSFHHLPSVSVRFLTLPLTRTSTLSSSILSPTFFHFTEFC